MGLLSGRRPRDLGVRDGKLKPVPRTPNCVCSQAPAADTVHYIEPLRFTGDANAAWRALHHAIAGMERVRIVQDEADYLYAEFESRLMGYVDDVEFHLAAGTQTIHVRSASRLGYGDHNVNRKRIEAVRSRFAAVLLSA